MINFDKFVIFADSSDAKKAAELFAEEIRLRTGGMSDFTDNADSANFIFRQADGICRDGYGIDCGENAVTVCASGIRGFIYGVGMFLRKIVPVCGVPVLTEDIPAATAPINPSVVIR